MAGARQASSGCSAADVLKKLLLLLAVGAVMWVAFQISDTRVSSLAAPKSPAVRAAAAVIPKVESKVQEEVTRANIPTGITLPDRTIRELLPAEYASHEALKDNPLLDLVEITWNDIVLADEDHLNQAIALWLFLRPEEICRVKWISAAKPNEDGSWPVCNSVSSKPPVPGDQCVVYSVGIGELPEFDIAASQEAGCVVRSYDPTINKPQGLPDGVTFHKVGLSGTDRLSSGESMPVGKLSTLKKEHGDQDKHIYVLKVDCEGCEFEAFSQMLVEEGPLALLKYDHVMFEIHFGWDGYTPQRAMALIALLHNAGYRRYWDHFNPWSIARGDTDKLLGTIRGLFGDEVAGQLEANRDGFLRLGAKYDTYKPRDEMYWQFHVRPGHMFCCWEFAFVREMSLPAGSAGAVGLDQESSKTLVIKRTMN